MKRALILLVMLAVIASSCLAETEGLRPVNGLYWGMDTQKTLDVLGLSSDDLIYMMQDVYMLQVFPEHDAEKVGMISLSLILVNDSLALMMYDCLQTTDDSLRNQSLEGLTSAYGEPTDGGAERFTAALGLLIGEEGLTPAELGAQGTGCSWELDDGTYMGIYDLTDISFSVYFVHEPTFADVGKLYRQTFPDTSAGSTPSDDALSLSEFMDEVTGSYEPVAAADDLDTAPSAASSANADIALLYVDTLAQNIAGTWSMTENDVHSYSQLLPDVSVYTVESPYGESSDITLMLTDSSSGDLMVERYFFLSGRLGMVTCAIEFASGDNSGLLSLLTASIADVYGAPSSPHPDKAYVAEALTMGTFTVEELQEMSSWTLEDGTLMILAAPADADDAFIAFWIHPELCR